jgi:hypothetical protein
MKSWIIFSPEAEAEISKRVMVDTFWVAALACLIFFCVFGIAASLAGSWRIFLAGLFANVLLTLVVAVANMRHEAPRAKVAYLRKITAGKDGFQKAPVPDELYAEIDSLLRTEVLILQEFRDPAGDTLLYENVPARVRDVRSRLRQLTGRSSPTDAKKG